MSNMETSCMNLLIKEINQGKTIQKTPPTAETLTKITTMNKKGEIKNS